MFRGCVYLIMNLLDGKLYIGQTTRSLKVRWQEHVRLANSDAKRSKLSDAIAYFGEENFYITPLEVVSYETASELHQKLNELERQYIALYNTNGDCGYNVTCGGSGPQWEYRSHEDPVDVYTIHGRLIATFVSEREAGRAFGVSSSNVSRICNGKRRQSNGYVFRRCGDKFDKFPVPVT